MGLPIQVFLLGLFTVFMVLLVVVLTGKAIIWFVNRFFEAAPTRKTQLHQAEDRIRPQVLAAISAAVKSATKGSGRITNIEKLQ